jgi:hypothetical protein
MHIPTVWKPIGGTALGALKQYNGKGYGFFEHVASPPNGKYRSHGHAGIDLHARHPIDNARADYVFAVHRGKANNIEKVPQYYPGTQTEDPHWISGNHINLSFTAQQTETGQGGSYVCGYLHLSSTIGAYGTSSNVLAGVVMGFAGRTGNLKPDWPGHVHMNLQMNSGNVASGVRRAPDDANKICVPDNSTALLYPCRCVVTSSQDASGCDFRFNPKPSTQFAVVETCWVVAELRCPSMLQESESQRKVQAQLRYLHDHPPADAAPGALLKPGRLDNTAGSSTKKAIRAFRKFCELPESDELGNDGKERLDAMAPVKPPEAANG